MKIPCLPLVLLLGLAACNGFNPPPASSPAVSTSITTEKPTPVSMPETVSETSLPNTLPASTQPTSLRVWVPEEFSPFVETPTGRLLKARLGAFQREHPGLELEVRVKASEGVGGLLDTLSTASVAAPSGLPDLVALPRPLLEAAALKGLVYPVDELTSVLSEEGWYDYARQLGMLQNRTFGLPFAGDALLLVYRQESIGVPPRDWEASFNLGQVLAFPAGDQQALFTLTLYRALGGIVQDEQGRPMLDEAKLSEVLNYYAQAGQAGVMPYWLTQYATDQQAWEGFSQEQYSMTSAWISYFLMLPAEKAEGMATAPLPTKNGFPFTLANGWVWAVAAPQPERQSLAAQLAEFLVEDAFLGVWTPVTGYLPTRPGALLGWQTPERKAFIDQLALSAQLSPSADVIANLGTPLQEAVVQVLKQEALPSAAAQAVLEALGVKP